MNNRGGFQRKAAVVFFLVDGFTGSPVKTARIFCREKGLALVNKRDGYYVLSDLPKGRYHFTIQADHYVTLEQEVLLEEEGPAIIQKALQHHLAGVLLEGITRIRALIMDTSQQIIAQDLVDVTVISTHAYGRLVEEATTEQNTVQLYCKDNDYTLEGKSYYLASPENPEKIKITAYHSEYRHHQLANKLEHHHHSGTPLYPLWELKTDANGEFLLPLPSGYAGKNQKVEIMARHGGKTGRETITLHPGRLHGTTLVLETE